MIGVIGMVRGDILSNPYGQVIREKHNPGTLSMDFAGTGMNLCRNLRALGEDVRFFSVAGNDLPGRAAKMELECLGVDVRDMLLLSESNTSMSLEIRNIVDELELSFGNFDVMEKMDEAYMHHRLDKINETDLLVCDGACSPDGWALLLENRKDTPLIVDPQGVEENKIDPWDLKYIHTIIPERREAEVISGLRILSEDELMEAGEWFIAHGVKRVFITLAGGGVYCREGEKAHVLRPDPVKIQSLKGAGDGFTSGVVFAQQAGKDLIETAQWAMAVAEMTLEARGYVNEKLSKEELGRRKNEQDDEDGQGKAMSADNQKSGKAADVGVLL